MILSESWCFMSESLKKALDSYEGRHVLWDIVADCGTFQNAFTGNSQTFFLLGNYQYFISTPFSITSGAFSVKNMLK